MGKTLAACEQGLSDFMAAYGEAKRRANKYGSSFGVFYSSKVGYNVGCANNPEGHYVLVAVAKPGGCLHVPAGVRLWDEVSRGSVYL